MGCFEVSTNLKEIGCFKVSTNLNEIGCFKVGFYTQYTSYLEFSRGINNQYGTIFLILSNFQEAFNNIDFSYEDNQEEEPYTYLRLLPDNSDFGKLTLIIPYLIEYGIIEINFWDENREGIFDGYDTFSIPSGNLYITINRNGYQDYTVSVNYDT